MKFQLGRGRPSSPLPLATPMLQLRKIKKVFANFLRGFWRFPTKFQLFKKYCCPRAEDRAIFEDLRLRGQSQGQGLDLRGQGQGLQNVFSRTSSRPRTSSRTPPLQSQYYSTGQDSHERIKTATAALNYGKKVKAKTDWHYGT